MAMAQNKFLNNPLSPHTGLEISEEILALGGGGPRVIAKPSRAGSIGSASSPYSHTDPSPSPPQSSAVYSIEERPSIAQAMGSAPQSPQPRGHHKHEEPQQEHHQPMPYWDPAVFMPLNMFPDYNAGLQQQQVQSPASADEQMMSNYIPAEFNDIFGVTSNNGADAYGSDVLGQLGFEMPYQSAVDQLQMMQ